MLFIFGLLIGAVMVIFALQNVTTITVTFLAWQLDGSVAFIVLASVVAGLLMSLLVFIPSLIKHEFKLSSAKKHNERLQRELEAHRTQLNAAATTPATPVVVEETVVVVEEPTAPSETIRL